MNKKVKFSGLWTAILSVVSVAYIFPILLVLINSFKKKAYISRYPFAIPTDKMFVGLENYVNGLTKTGFFQAFGWTLFITVFSVAVILLCTSMCAWYINRVTNTLTKTMYMLCLFSMVVPFQMVMFTLSKIANILKLNTPWGSDHHLSWIWSRTCGIYVQRFCKIHSDRDRGSCHDRWLYPDPDIF